MLNDIALNVWRCFPPILLILGTLGNILAIVVLMQRQNRNSSIAKYLSSLAVADLIVLWMALPRHWLYNGYGLDIRSHSELICKLNVFLLYFGSHSSSWLVVMVTFERFISSCSPVNVRVVCSPRNANVIIVSMATFLLLLDSHVLYGMGHTDDIQSTVVCYPTDEIYAYFLSHIWSLITFVLFSLTPLVIMLTVNIFIIIRIITVHRKSRTQVIPLTLTSQALARKAKARQTTVMLIALNVVYMICTTPFLTFLILYSDWILSLGNDRSNTTMETVWVLVNILFYTNYASNFVLYFLSGSKFRNETKQLLCRIFVSSPATRNRVNIRQAERNIQLQDVNVPNA